MTRFPIVVHRTLGSPADHQVDAFIKRANDILERKTPHVVIFDSSEAGLPSAYMRKRNMEWLKERQADVAKHCVGVATVTPSSAMRFVISTAMLVWSQPVAHEVFATVDEARAWANTRLRG